MEREKQHYFGVNNPKTTNDAMKRIRMQSISVKYPYFSKNRQWQSVLTFAVFDFPYLLSIYYPRSVEKVDRILLMLIVISDESHH